MKKVLLFFTIITFIYTLPLLYANNLELFYAQKKLKSLGYNPGIPDNIIGPITINAIRKFQEENGLQITGNLNEDTKNQLGINTDMDYLIFESKQLFNW